MRTLPLNQILIGDARTVLADLPAASVDCVVTSPPYFRLRNYQHDAQLGLEDHVDQWVNELQLVMRGLRRVLKPTGSLWLNLGDTYARHERHGARENLKVLHHAAHNSEVAIDDALRVLLASDTALSADAVIALAQSSAEIPAATVSSGVGPGHFRGVARARARATDRGVARARERVRRAADRGVARAKARAEFAARGGPGGVVGWMHVVK